MTLYDSLWDWRRQVADLYRAVRAEPDPQAAWRALARSAGPRCIREHPQTPLEDRARRSKPCRSSTTTRRCASSSRSPPRTAPEELFPARGGWRGPPAALRPHLRPGGGARRRADAYWLQGYCGGVFLPFADATSGRETYGGGRYLLDTIKSADLGAAPDGRTVLDFNFAYNPSCAYSPRYVCPLSPRGQPAAGGGAGGGAGAGVGKWMNVELLGPDPDWNAVTHDDKSPQRSNGHGWSWGMFALGMVLLIGFLSLGVGSGPPSKGGLVVLAAVALGIWKVARRIQLRRGQR